MSRIHYSFYIKEKQQYNQTDKNVTKMVKDPAWKDLADMRKDVNTFNILFYKIVNHDINVPL